MARRERGFDCPPPRLKWLLWTEEERGGRDYGFYVYAMGMAKVWAGGGSHRDPGETGSWMHAFRNMISDSSHKSFGVSALREQRYNGDREPSVTPFLRSPEWGLGLLGYEQGKGRLMAWRVGRLFWAWLRVGALLFSALAEGSGGQC